MGITVAESMLKVNLSELLERAASGEEITVTRLDGPPVKIVRGQCFALKDEEPDGEEKRDRRRRAFAALDEAAKDNRLGDISIKELIEEGRA